jgi:hypothetical protein
MYLQGEYATILLQIGDTGKEIDKTNTEKIKKKIEEIKKEMKNKVTFRIIERDPKIDRVIATESGSGLQYRGAVPDVMIEIKMDKNTDIDKIALQLLDRKIVRELVILTPGGATREFR